MSIMGVNNTQVTYQNFTRTQRSGGQNKTTFEKQTEMAKKGHIVYMMTPEKIYSGGNGTGLSFYIEYAKETSEADPTVIAKGVDENGQEFKQTIHINHINPENASLVEMRALEAHYHVDKGMGLDSFPHGTGDMGLHDKRDFIFLFEKNIEDMQRLGRYDLSMFYAKNKNVYLSLIGKNREITGKLSATTKQNTMARDTFTKSTDYGIVDKLSGKVIYLREDQLVIQKDPKTGMEFMINPDENPIASNVRATDELKNMIYKLAGKRDVEVKEIGLQSNLTINRDPKTGLQYLTIHGDEGRGASIIINSEKDIEIMEKLISEFQQYSVSSQRGTAEL